MKVKAGLNITVVCSVAFAIFFMGWLIYDIAELWQYLTPHQYQNVLFLWMAGACIAGFGLIKRSLKENATTITVDKETSSKQRANSPQCNPDIAELKTQLNEMAEKLADLHAIGQITKKRKEAKPDA